MEKITDLVNKKVVQSNDLVTSVAKMDKVPLKFFELAVSALDTINEPENKVVQLKKELLYSYFDFNNRNKKKKLEEALMDLHSKVVFHVRYQDGELLNEDVDLIISGVAQTKWKDKDDFIEIEFTEKIMPFLIELKKNFTQYLISDIAKLENKYSIIMYKWINLNYNQYEYYKNSGERTKEQLEQLKNPRINLSELREMTDTKDLYKSFSNLDLRVLKVLEKEINEHTAFKITYEKIRHGRNIGSIRFFITKKQVAENGFYKDELEDPLYLADKKAKELAFKEDYEKAKANPYTALLVSKKLVELIDVFDEKLMVELERTVYPEYKKLEEYCNERKSIVPKEKSGAEVLNEHLNYVKAHQLDTELKNVAKYLRKCITQHIQDNFYITKDH